MRGLLVVSVVVVVGALDPTGTLEDDPSGNLIQRDDTPSEGLTDFDDWVAPKLGRNVTEEMEELEEEEKVWVRDVVWEAMVTTAWQDYITRLNRERALYGVQLEPLKLEEVTGLEEMALERSLLGYQVALAMRNTRLHGLSSLSLHTLNLSRDTNLTSILVEAVLDAPSLLLTGLYRMEARAEAGLLSYLLPDLSSEGLQEFTIAITGARVRCELVLELVQGCGEEGEATAAITHITFPFSYRDIDFQFSNLGSVLGAVVEGLGGWVIDYLRGHLVHLIREYIGSEVPGLVCSSYTGKEAAAEAVDLEDRSSPVFPDSNFRFLLHQEEGALLRDRLAESTVTQILRSSVLRHLRTVGSPLRAQLDPLQLFPIDIKFKKDVYRADVEVCDAWVHHLRSTSLHSMVLARDQGLGYSALRVQVALPLAWLSGYYKLRNAYLFTFIPAGGSGDFNVDLKDVRVSLAVILRHSEGHGLQMDHFMVDLGWQTLVFKFDGLWSGLEDIADKVMNQFGVANLIVAKQKEFIMKEIKTYLRGLAVCMMWSPSQGLDLCMRDFWEGLGWEWPWVYPTCQ